jgi:hypothetical protein
MGNRLFVTVTLCPLYQTAIGPLQAGHSTWQCLLYASDYDLWSLDEDTEPLHLAKRRSFYPRGYVKFDMRPIEGIMSEMKWFITSFDVKYADW